MRRTPAALAVIGIAATLLLVVPAPASAAYKPPVDPYPGLPSQEYKTWVQTASGPATVNAEYLPGTIAYDDANGIVREYVDRTGAPTPAQVNGAKVEAIKTEKLIFDKSPAPTTGRPTTATVPRAISAPSAFTRAAAGPLVGAFTGGFAIGTAGLALYGAISGNDPLADICGSGFEGVGSVIYMGMMPDCTARVTTPNSDQQAGVNPMSVPGLTYTWGGSTHYPSNNNYSHCVIATYPAGGTIRLQVGATAGAIGSITVGDGYAPACANVGRVGYGYVNLGYGSRPLFRAYNTQTGQVVATETVAPPGNPTRNAKCKITFEDGAVVEAQGFTFEEESGFPVSSSGTGCDYAYSQKSGAGPRLMPSEILVTSETPGQPSTEVVRQKIPALDEDERAALEDTTGKGLALYKGTSSCLAWEADCSQWWSETDNGASTTTDYRCTYGNSTVRLAQCYVYRDTFSLEAATPTILDPATGEPQTWSGDDSQNSTDPADGPTPGEQCMSTWSAAPNPIEWVFHPVKCAFVWAFVPRDSVVAQVQADIGGGFDGSAFGAITGSVSGLGGIFAANSGCGGLPFDFDAFGVEFRGQLFESCSEPWAGVATVTRNIISGVILVGGFLAILRYGAGVFGFVGLGMGVGDRQDSGGGVRFK